MQMPAKSIDEIRSASRTIVRELGFMRPTLAGTAYSASAVHALLEIDAQGGVSAAHLVTALGLEKSSVSRMLSKLIAAGDIAESASAEDARLKQLTLTGQGKALVKKIHAYGRNQVTSAMALPEAELDGIRAALRKRFGREVELETAVDESLIGGAVIDAGDVVIDGSLRGKLARLQSALAG